MTSRNHALWIAPVLGVFGLLSYFTIFAQWPLTRDFPWLNLILVGAAALLSIFALVQAWPRGGWRIAAGLASTLVSLGAAAGLATYVFVLSYALPEADLALPVGSEIPTVQLASLDAKPFTLDANASEKLVLVFYRGHW